MNGLVISVAIGAVQIAAALLYERVQWARHRRRMAARRQIQALEDERAGARIRDIRQEMDRKWAEHIAEFPL